MTNFTKWQSYTNHVPAPQNFIDWSYHFMIAACLQRRVWCFSDEDKCYGNMNVILVGPPGIGKGLCTKRVMELMRFHKLKDIIQRQDHIPSEAERQAAKQLEGMDLKAAQDLELNQKKAGSEEALLFPIAADATTYEALVQSMAQCYRRVTYKEYSKEHQKEIMQVQGHSSLAFVLDELSSLLRKRTEDTVNFLLTAYNCGEDYTYKTKTQGTDRIKRICLNMIAGTTPDFMQSTFDDELIGNGFSSRSFFIYATKPRFAAFRMAKLTEEQLEYKKDLLDHILKLYRLYGECHIDKETVDFMQKVTEEDLKNPHNRANKSSKLAPYYARKNIHTTKVAMALHFGNSLDMHIPLERFMEAREWLDREERTMHIALTLEGENPLAKPARKIMEHLQRIGKDTFNSMLADFYGHVRKSELEEILVMLQETDKIETKQLADTLGQPVLYYRIKE